MRSQVVAWLDERKPEDAVRRQVLTLWPESETTADASKQPTSAQLLERVVTTLSLVDPQAKQLADLCTKPHDAFKTPQFAWLADSAKLPPSCATICGCASADGWLSSRCTTNRWRSLADLQPADVVDPASLLFYQSVCQHWMLHKTEGLKSIAKLLEQKKTIPRRYAQMAELMQADLSALEDDSLDHISRRMNDVTRRLDFGHAGKQVRGVEDGIIASLDKLIKQKEDEAASSGSGGSGDEDKDDRAPADRGAIRKAFAPPLPPTIAAPPRAAAPAK